MRLLDALMERFTKASAVARDIAFGSTGQVVWTPRRYDLLTQQSYLKNAIAYACVNEIAKGVSQTPILVYEVGADGAKREVSDHPVAKLLNRPNPTQGRSEFFEAAAAFFAISGNSYIEGVGPETGPKAGSYHELWVKRPDRMKIIPGENGVEAYRHDVNGRTYTWPVDPVTQRCGILHLKRFHPLNDWYGLSPIEVGAMDVDAHNETREWNQHLLRNGARPSGALSTERRLTDGQFERLKAMIIEKYSGMQNAGKPLLLEDGLTWQQFSFSPRDMDFLESRYANARDICIAFGVPPMLLGIPGDNTYSNQREARLAFFDTTVVWYLDRLCSGLGSWLLGQETKRGQDRFEIGYDLDAVPAMAYRREMLFERASKATFLTTDEARDMAGWGKLEPPNPNEPGSVLFVPNTMRPLEQAMQAPPDPIELARAQAEARASVGVAGGAGAPPPGKPGAAKPAAPAPAAPRRKPPVAANDKSARVDALMAAPGTLRAARAELGYTKTAFALWLVSEEGLDDEDAAALAELSEAEQA